jgi:hypothetical protein
MQMGGGAPQPLIRWRSANRDKKSEESGKEEDDKENRTIKVLKPGEIKSGRYSKEDTVSPEDMAVMLETVTKYERDDPNPSEEITPVDSTVLSDDDSYVKALKEKKIVPVA